MRDMGGAIPPEDRKREQIAARISARRIGNLSTFRQRASSSHPRTDPYLSWQEAIGIRAFGRATSFDGPDTAECAFLEKWGSISFGADRIVRRYPLIWNLRRAMLRARWWQLRKRLQAGGRCPIGPLNWAERSTVRVAIRQNGGTAERVLRELSADVEHLLNAFEVREAAIVQATARLRAEIASGTLVALGIPGVYRTKRFTSGMPKRIPPQFFANPYATILGDGWATLSWEAPMQFYADWKGPDWGDVRLKQEDVLRFVNEVQREPVTVRESLGQGVNITPPRLAIPNKPGTGGKKAAAATEAFVRAVREGRIAYDTLRRMKQKQLEGIYPEAKRTTLTQSREAALAILANLSPDKAPT